ncbi:MAG TPA: tRNA preQ1(34) S-adenosylmethionine ribosyltransferase-isomerase QueA [Blastocatellia bacterium]|nr:tRNA preQ1(34) S-adenosylmethionine ribosyltransferase-isomerase QueA [Blastocatellia bacterium]
MLVSDFDYDLPGDLIAQEPSQRRDDCRLLVVDRDAAAFTDSSFTNLPRFLKPGDVLVLNNTRVFPARLIGKIIADDAQGNLHRTRRAEIFLVRPIGPLLWEALVKPGRSLRIGARVEFNVDGNTGGVSARETLTAEIVQGLPNGRRVVRFQASSSDFDAIVDRLGRTPLPPYIKRTADLSVDRERYQTVYAKQRGSIAAPTAGLHFTDQLLDRVSSRGVEIIEITLHVGYGTFQPVRAEQVEDHSVETERYFISDKAARSLNAAQAESRRIIAVGTTTTRALESAARRQEKASISSSGLAEPEHQPAEVLIQSGGADTGLFIRPGFEFRVINGLVTNFHLPRSSLLMLVSAFAGRELTLRAYRHAVESRYRFYSYGDAMLIL